MKVIKTKAELIEEISVLKKMNQTIGFVPTMGALHDGHISLVKESTKDCDNTYVSIFVNPTQFNNKEDLEKYPRDIEKDLKLLEETGCNGVFIPSVEEMYPSSESREFNFDGLDKVMEGQFRPGHFNGVGLIVSKLFDIVQPDKAFFGQKDFQQVAIIRKLVEILDYKIKIIACPIYREENGLAMSSRNERLTVEQRKNAGHIYKTLTKYINLSNNYSVNELKELIIKEVNNNAFLDVEYFEVVDEISLTPVSNWKTENNIYGCIAVFCGNVRLIDNIKFNL